MKRHLLFTLLILGWMHALAGANVCDINELVVEPFECENGLFFVHIDFNIVDPVGDQFSVQGNGENYGLFPYDSLPIILGPLPGDGITEWEFVIADVVNPECNAVFILGTVNCCSISEVVVDPTECTNPEVFNAIVNFNHDNTGGLGFDVFNANGGFLGFFNYDDLPVTVTGIPSVNGNTHITICDNDNPDCCAAAEFESLDCSPNNCEIFNVDVIVGDCANGQFFVVLGFNHENTSDSFNVHGNGHDYGTFPYSSLPITLGPFAGNGETIYEFVVNDVVFEDCNDFAVVGPVFCSGQCGFNDVVIDPLECQGEGYYAIELDFIPIETSDGFSVHSQGMLLGSFSYDELPVFIDSFPASCNFFDVLTICDNADTSCCETHDFQALLCCEDCLIYDLIAENTLCDSNNQFYVVLNFQYLNVSDLGFSVAGNGNMYGNFNYDELPLTLGPFDGDGETFYEFVVTDLGDNFCFDGTELGFVNCVCGFDSLSVDPLECTGNGTYAIHVNFFPVGVTNAGFDVWAGDDFVGYFLYENLPIVIEHFPDHDGPVDVITICDNDNPSCCASLEFEENLDCGGCDIFDLVAEAFDCNEETNTFALYIDFNWEGSVESFNVYKGDLLIGTVNGADLPDTLYGLTDDGGGALITVCSVAFPDCCASEEIPVPQCGIEPCDILGINAEPFNCNPENGTFDLYLDFDWEGNIGAFDVFMGDIHVGFVLGGNLPDTLFGLVDDGGGALITVCANDHPDCCGSVEIVPGCVEGCDIFELVAEAFDCDTLTNTFALYIDFQWTGNDEVFHVYKGDHLIGTVIGANLPDTLYGLTDNGGGALITVCADNHPDCCASEEIGVPDCGAVCEIFEVNADPGGCTSDSTFEIAITYQYQGFMNEFVELWTGDTYLGFFHVSVQPIVIEDFPWNGHEVMPLRICQNDHPDCCRTIEFEVPSCLFGGECAIHDLVAESIGCSTDSTFAAIINYIPIGFDGPVQVWAGDTYLGIYPQFIPLVVTNIPEQDGGVVLTVCQAENAECCAVTEIDGLICENVCAINELNATVSDCEEGTFTVTLDFNFNNQSDSFLVAGNGNVYGLFGYSQVPLTLGPFEGNGETQWEFVVLDVENPVCLDFVNVGVVDCSTGISGISKSQPLEIQYGPGGTHFIVPDGASEYSMWTYDGKLITRKRNLTAGEKVLVSRDIPVPGLYLIHVKTDDKVFIGKVVGF